jgi:glyoxylase-like metal-dependent hydrolase (beta-lactamase superfamily II)
MTTQVYSVRAGMSVAHLVASESGMMLVDAGCPGTAGMLTWLLRKVGRNDLRLIFITHAHFDHYGAAAEMRRRTGAPIVIHRADARAMELGDSPVTSARGFGGLVLWLASLPGHRTWAAPTTADLMVGDGQELEGLSVSVSVLHTPGHTDGSSCLLVDRRLAFVGDLLSGPINTGLQRVFAVDWSQLPHSLRRLQMQRPELAYTGHGIRPVRGTVLQNLPAAGA